MMSLTPVAVMNMSPTAAASSMGMTSKPSIVARSAKMGSTSVTMTPVKATVGLFIGCVYNLRQQQSALDVMEVLKRNGIRTIIPKDQVCCGSPLSGTGQLPPISTICKHATSGSSPRGASIPS